MPESFSGAAGLRPLVTAWLISAADQRGAFLLKQLNQTLLLFDQRVDFRRPGVQKRRNRSLFG
jgi:hypothetical protein